MSGVRGPSSRDDLVAAGIKARSLAFRRAVDDGYTVSEASESSGFTEATIQHLLSSREWPEVKIGRGPLVPRFVLHDGEEVPGIRDISSKAGRYGWTVYDLARFLLTPGDWIGYDGVSIRDHLIAEGNSAVPGVLKMVSARS